MRGTSDELTNDELRHSRTLRRTNDLKEPELDRQDDDGNDHYEFDPYFALEGKIHWATGGILSVGMAAGGWFASRWSVDKGEVWIKRVMIVTILILAIKLWFF